MIQKLQHLYRSLITFKINPFRFLYLKFAKTANFNAEDFINKNDFSFKYFENQFDTSKFSDLGDIEKILCWHSEKWQSHFFDLLGTGWVQRNNGTKAVGFLGFTVPENSRLKNDIGKCILCQRAAQLIEDDYQKIDWHFDIKSGYRWNAKKDSKSISDFTKTPYGVDVKIPWELARMNHLTLLVLSSHCRGLDKKKILKEFRNISLDFIAHNQFKRGVNWSNAMEVAIRATNLLLAYDFAKNLDEDNILDESFKSVFFDSIFEHTKYIIEHSEYKHGLTNNHYYANISALLFIGFYLQKTESGKNLIGIASREIFFESQKQFLEDGGNFEASTHYHGLTSEMLLWNCLLMKSLFEKDLIPSDTDLRWNTRQKQHINPEDELDQLLLLARKVLYFSHAITKPNGNIAACGDQDSGRFIKLGFSGKWMNFEKIKKNDHQISEGNYDWNDEDILWQENSQSQIFLQVLGQFVYNENSKSKAHEFPIENVFSKYLSVQENENIPVKKPKSVKFGDLLFWHTSTIFYTDNIPNLKKNLNWYLFPRFGIYIAKTDDFFLSIIASNNHLPKYWSHGKNDKLSFELQVNGKDIIVDPGSFNYTADSDLRNKFRSTKSHSTISVKNKEQNRWPEGKLGVFNLYSESKCKFLAQIDNSITLLCKYRGIKHIRTFKIHNDHLEIVDECNREFETHFNYKKIYSDHYGRWIKSENEY